MAIGPSCARRSEHQGLRATESVDNSPRIGEVISNPILTIAVINKPANPLLLLFRPSSLDAVVEPPQSKAPVFRSTSLALAETTTAIQITSSNDLDVLREAFRRRFLAKGERVSSQAPSLAVELNCTDAAERVCTEPRGVGLRKLETV